MNEQEIYQKALQKWGSELQIIMMIEEMSELTKEMTKWFRGKYDVNHIIEEIVDVEIMLNQMKLLVKEYPAYERIRKEKLARLEEMLK